MRIVEELSSEARNLEDREEGLVKEINHYKSLIRSALLAPMRIKELEMKLDAVRCQQREVEAQILEVQMQQMVNKGLVVGIKGIGGKNHGH